MTDHVLKTTIKGRDGLGNMATFSYDRQSDQLVAMHPDGHWAPMRSPTDEERTRILAKPSVVPQVEEPNVAPDVALALKIRELTASYFALKSPDPKAAARIILAIETEATRVLVESTSKP